MARTAFLGIDTGNITWAGLLEGSAGVVGALLVAWYAFWLQSRHAGRAALRQAVVEYRDEVIAQRLRWVAERGKRLDVETMNAAVRQDTAKITRADASVVALARRYDRTLAFQLASEVTPHLVRAVEYGDLKLYVTLDEYLSAWLSDMRRFRFRRESFAAVARRLEIEGHERTRELWREADEAKAEEREEQRIFRRMDLVDLVEWLKERDKD